MSERLRIAYIGIKGLPSQAGVDRVVEAIVRRLVDRYDITVYCSPLAVAPDTTYPGVKLVRVPVLRGKHGHATTLFLMSALDAVFLRDFDIIHLHNAEAGFVLPLLKCRYPVVSTSHGLSYARDKWSPLAKLLMQMADWPFIKLSNVVTSVSQTVADHYMQQYHRQVTYIPNGVGAEDTEQDMDGAQALLRSHGIEPGNYLLFAAGRVIPSKGAEILLEAYGNLPSAPPLLLVGKPEAGSPYERQLHEIADSRVVFCPSVNQALLMGLVRLAKLFVFPSSIEAMSRMLLEAAVTGVPLICSDIPENVAVVGDHALYFRSMDVADLQSKLVWALDHLPEMAVLGEMASHRVLRLYPWDSIVHDYEDLYHIHARQPQRKPQVEL